MTPAAWSILKRKVSGDIIYCATPEETLKDADICLILTEWPEVMELQPDSFLAMKRPIILDGRNCYDPGVMAGYHLVYDSIGRTVVSNLD
jgi:UDPglucose 6-dehydrogenase